MKPTVCTYLCDGKLLLRCIKPSSQTPILHRCVCVCTSVLCYSLQMMQEHRSTITTDLLFACLLTVYCQIGTYSVRFMVSSKYKSSTSNAWCVWWAERVTCWRMEWVHTPAQRSRTWWEKRLRKWAAFCPLCGWGHRTDGEFEMFVFAQHT